MKKDQGFIKWIILIVIALIILGYFGFNLRDAVEAPATRDNLSFFKDILLSVWNNILKVPALFVWEHVISPLIHMLTVGKRG
jgi:hypothetical protein